MVINLQGASSAQLVVSCESLAKAQAWLESSELKALAPQRERAYKVVRQFIVEARADQGVYCAGLPLRSETCR
jgi:hypothetical protein